MRLMLTLLVLLTSGCVSTEMKSYVGQDIREVILVSGQPIAAMDMGNGVRAFQFMWGGTGTTAIATRSNAQVSSTDRSGWLSNTSITSSGGAFISDGCVISYLTEWSAEKQAWIVTGYRYPKRLIC